MKPKTEFLSEVAIIRPILIFYWSSITPLLSIVEHGHQLKATMRYRLIGGSTSYRMPLC